ncbi:TPA: hypothetical protein DIC38_03155 [Candidatus Nomurabacteria bacterium]|nr:MAG: hypothetical protein O210_OD1C00001G0153 [Parcubacteria bacterium RAAC4_OD1_1]HCY26650.1 hypothetical protein [Candidatus Nomurabacteria bacterium]
MGNNGYFVDVVVGFEDTSINDSSNITCREFYRQIHVADRPKGHSANRIIINKFDEIIAVKCSCSSTHPVLKNGKYSVLWDMIIIPKYIVIYKNMTHNNFLNCLNL